MMIVPQATDAFIRHYTNLIRPPLTPEIVLHLAADPYGIFLAAEHVGAARPYWAFAWAGGQALARSHPRQPRRGRRPRVLDLGAGSGLVAIAAMKAGAHSALAADTDPLAVAAAKRQRRRQRRHDRHHDRRPARHRRPTPISSSSAICSTSPSSSPASPRSCTCAARRGTQVLFADRTTARRPPLRLDLVAELPRAADAATSISATSSTRASGGLRPEAGQARAAAA